ncbi:MAG: DnaJ domain-containing protein [Lacibacter sp.]
MKDYYAILEIPVTASVPEIKQAYRKLVMIFHPDKNNADPYSLSRFNEIKEAYETLINPLKKDQYLQQRWLYKATGKNIGEELITPPNILKQVLELNKEIAGMDIHRMDHAGIVNQVKQLMNTEVMEKLFAYNEKEINQTILHTLIRTMNVLPLKQTKEMVNYLSPLVQNDDTEKKALHRLLKNKQKQHQKQMLQPVIVFLLVIIICFIIWVSGKK